MEADIVLLSDYTTQILKMTGLSINKNLFSEWL